MSIIKPPSQEIKPDLKTRSEQIGFIAKCIVNDHHAELTGAAQQDLEKAVSHLIAAKAYLFRSYNHQENARLDEAV